MTTKKDYIKAGVDRFIYSPSFNTIREHLLSPKILECFYDNEKQSFKKIPNLKLKDTFEELTKIYIKPDILFDKIIDGLINSDRFLEIEKNFDPDPIYMTITEDGKNYLFSFLNEQTEFENTLKKYFQEHIVEKFYSENNIVDKNSLLINFDPIFKLFKDSLDYVTNARVTKSDLVQYWGSKGNLHLKTHESIYPILNEHEAFNYKNYPYYNNILELVNGKYIEFITYEENDEPIESILAYLYYNKVANIIFENPAIHEILLADLKEKLFYCDTNAIISLVTDHHANHTYMYHFSSYLKEIALFQETDQINMKHENFLNILIFPDTNEEFKNVLSYSKKIFDNNRYNLNINIRYIRDSTKYPVFYIDYVYGKWNNWRKYHSFIEERVAKVKQFSLSAKNLTEFSVDKSVIEFVKTNLKFIGKTQPQRDHDISIISKIIVLRIEEYKFTITDINDPLLFIKELKLNLEKNQDNRFIYKIIYYWLNTACIEKTSDTNIQKNIITEILNKLLLLPNLPNFCIKTIEELNKMEESTLLIPTNRNFLEGLFKESIVNKCSSIILPKTWLITFDHTLLDFANKSEVKQIIGHYPICIGYSALKRIMWPYMSACMGKRKYYSQDYRSYIRFKDISSDKGRIFLDTHNSSSLSMALQIDNLKDRHEYFGF
jgi:hypothetical protein